MTSEENIGNKDSKNGNGVFESEEHPRYACIFVPQSEKSLLIDKDVLAHLGRIQYQGDDLDAIYLSLRNVDDFEPKRNSFPRTMEFCVQNNVLIRASYNHDFLLEDLADGRGEGFLRIGYIGRNRESDIENLSSKLRSMFFKVEKFEVA